MSKLVLIDKLLTVKEAINILVEYHENIAVVVSEEGVPIGIVHLLDALSTDDATLVEEIMSEDYITIKESDVSVQQILKVINDKMIPIICVDENNCIENIIYNNEIIDKLKYYIHYIESLLNNVEDGIIAVDDNMNITYMNKTYRQIHKISNDDLIGKNIIDSFPESRLMEINAMNDCIVIDEPLHLNYSGATVMPSYRAITEDDEYLGASAIVKDFSKTKNLYIGINMFNELNKRIGIIFDNMKEAVFIVDNNLNFTYKNKRLKEMFDKDEELSFIQQEIKSLLKKRFDSLESLDTFNDTLDLPDNKSFAIVGIPLCGSGGSKALESMVLMLQDNTKIQTLKSEIQRKRGLLDYFKSQVNKIPEEMVCESIEFKEVVSTALKAANSDATIIIEGENGVGKELVANLIHTNSNRKDMPFIPVNCGAIPDSLFESEMFGYEEGAFTGANKGGKTGILEMADGGTVFLDEVSEISLASQVKLLRFLQNMEIAKVGREIFQKVNVRIIAATNKNLKQMVQNGQFREDLFYRLNIVKITVPPLRERKEEIKPLALKFLKDFNMRYKKDLNISKEALKSLTDYKWPGNIRQLRNVIEQSVIMCERIIQTYDLLIDNIEDNVEKIDKHNRSKGILSESEVCDLPLRTSILEQELIVEALKRTNGNKSEAIKLLNIGRKTFYKKLKDYELIT